MLVNPFFASHRDAKRTANSYIEGRLSRDNVPWAHPFPEAFRIGPCFVHDFPRRRYSPAHLNPMPAISGCFHAWSSSLRLGIFERHTLPVRPFAVHRIAGNAPTTHLLRAKDTARSSSSVYVL